MAAAHSLEAYLEKAEQDATKDFHLAFMAKSEFTEFFKKQDKGPQWDSKLAQLTNLRIERSPIFEALLLFGKWKTGKQYKDGVKSAEKFEEMEKTAYERNWVWLLSYCVETAAYIYKSFGHDSNLNTISKRICSYLVEKKDTLPAHTLLELTRTFNNIITTADKKDMETVYGLLVNFSGKKFTDDPFNFMRGFLFEALKIAHFSKHQDEENRLHELVIKTWIDEAEIKGKASKLVKFSLLKSALDYSVNVGNKEKIENLKKELY